MNSKKIWALVEPLLLALFVADVPLVVSFVNEIVSKSTSTVTTIVLGAGIAALNAAVAWARSKVTPLANPKDDNGTPLAPVVSGNYTHQVDY